MKNFDVKNVDLVIFCGTILTFNKNNEIIHNKAIVVNDSIIIDICDFERAKTLYIAGEIVNAYDKIVMPGLINAHTHFPMVMFRGLVDDIVLQDWLFKYIFPAEQKFITPETVEISTELAIAEAIRTGTTCFFDMYYYEDVVAQVAKKTGMRAVISEGIIDFKVANSDTPQQGIKNTEYLLNKYSGDPLITVAVAAHSPYTCSKDLLVETKELARKYNALYHIHLSETKEEFENSLKKHGKTPTEYLDSLNILDDKVVAAHCVWLSDNDQKILAEKQVGIVHNPECNTKISSGIAPITSLLQLGAKIGVGTDGAASNNNLNMFQEIHTMSLIHKVTTMNPTVISAYEALYLATMGSAKVLNMQKLIGSIEIGKKADLITLEQVLPYTKPLYNFYSSLVYSFLGNEVNDVIVNGKILLKDKNYTTINISALYEKFEILTNNIAKEFGIKH